MNISVSGNGENVVWIHGYCETSAIWGSFKDYFQNKLQVVLVDLPGHGRSEPPHESFSIEDIAHQLHQELLDHGISKYFVVGHSLGGYIALALEELYPKFTIGIGLFSSNTEADDENKRVLRDKVSTFVHTHGVEQFLDSFLPSLFASENRKKLSNEINELKRRAATISPHTIVAYAQAMKNRPDRTAVFANCNKPVFVIAGERDLAVRLEVSKKMIERIKIGDSLVLQGVGHNGFLESKNDSLLFLDHFFETFIMQ